MGKTLFFTTAFNPQNIELARNMVNSFHKFHPNTEVKVFTQEDLPNFLPVPGYEWNFRITPLFAVRLLQEYDTVVRLDTDQIITGNLDHILEGDYDVAVVQNSNPRDYMLRYRKTGQMLTAVDIPYLDYVNCGFVVIKNLKFAQHWFGLCNSKYFPFFQFREQDFLNILIHYFPYKTKFLDKSNKWHGLISKGFWPQIELKDDKLILPKNDEWPKDESKEIVCLHVAGGGSVSKFHDLNIRFKPEVINHLKGLIK